MFAVSMTPQVSTSANARRRERRCDRLSTSSGSDPTHLSGCAARRSPARRPARRRRWRRRRRGDRRRPVRVLAPRPAVKDDAPTSIRPDRDGEPLIAHHIFLSRRSAVNSTSAVSISQRSRPTRTMSSPASRASARSRPATRRYASASRRSSRRDSTRVRPLSMSNASTHPSDTAGSSIGEAHVGHQQEDVVHGVQERQLVNQPAPRREQKVRDDRHERRLPQLALDGRR